MSRNLAPDYIREFLVKLNRENESLMEKRPIRIEEIPIGHNFLCDSGLATTFTKPSTGMIDVYDQAIFNKNHSPSLQDDSLDALTTELVSLNLIAQQTEPPYANNYNLYRYLKIDSANEPLRLEARIALGAGRVQEGEDMMKRKLSEEPWGVLAQGSYASGLGTSDTLACDIDSASEFLTLEENSEPEDLEAERG